MVGLLNGRMNKSTRNAVPSEYSCFNFVWLFNRCIQDLKDFNFFSRKLTNDWMNKCRNESLNDWMNEWMNEWTNEYGDE